MGAQQERASRDPIWLREAIERTAPTLGNEKPTLHEIKSAGAKGYYFQVQHEEKFPIGEFSFLVACIVDLGGITVVFNAYANQQDAAEIGEALKVVESARFVAAN